MKKSDEYINAEILYSVHNIDFTFISSLHENGLIEATIIEGSFYLSPSQIGELEKMIRLHFELNINIEGLVSVAHLLKKVNDLTEENRKLRNRIILYSEEE